MPIEKNYFSISPLNDNPLQSTGTNGITGGFSFRESNPIVKKKHLIIFQITVEFIML